MEKNFRCFFILCLTLFSLFLFSKFLTVYADSDSIEIEQISVSDKALYISWYPLENTTGYNVKYYNSKKENVFTDFVGKNECISNISDYSNISTIEIIGAKKDGTTNTKGINIKTYKGYPLNVDPVILGCSNEDNGRKVVINPELNLTSLRIYNGSWKDVSLKDYLISKGGTGKYTLLAEATLLNGRKVYGIYSGGNISEKELEAPKPECMIKDRAINDGILGYKIDNAPSTVTFNIYNELSEKIDSQVISNINGEFFLPLPENSAKVLILKADNGIDFTDVIYSDGILQPLNISEKHLLEHEPEPNEFLFEVNHPATSISNEPFLYPKIVLGKQTLLDIVINSNITYKNLSIENMEKLYIPLFEGDNNISMIAHTLDGQTSTRSFIVTYKNKNAQRVDELLNQDMSISFIGIENNATITTSQPIIAGHITGGTNLLVNDIAIDLDVNNDFEFAANLKEGINSLEFKIVGPRDKTYSQILTLTYKVPDLITGVTNLQDGTKKYKELPKQETVEENAEETELPSYEDVLEKDDSAWIYGGICILGFIILGIIIIRNYKKNYIFHAKVD